MRTDLMEVLSGRMQADLAIVNGRIVDVWSGRIAQGGIAVKGDRIVRVGDIGQLLGPKTRVLDARNQFVTPGLIEPHAHAYHANMNMTEYARTLLQRGTTAVTEASYFAGQMAGLQGVRFFIEELRRTPLTVLFQSPALGYLQNLELGLPGRPDGLTGPELLETLDWEGNVGPEEPPLVPFLERDPYILQLVEGALARNQVFMGHGAGLKGKDLEAYAAIGVTADHECIAAEEAVERVKLGVMVALRECAVARNQKEVQRAITEFGCDPHFFMFCADAIDAVSVARVGHIDQGIRLAVQGGIDPLVALRMATLNPARYYRRDQDLGSLTPGRQADILFVGDLSAFDVRTVIAKGEPVVLDGEFVANLERPTYPAFLQRTIRLRRRVTPEDLRLEAPAGRSDVTVRVIGGELLVSDERHLRAPVVDGSVTSDVSHDVLKIAMFDRYGRWDKPSIGFIQGYGLKRGAIGTTYNPFYNNVMVMGTNDTDMAVAANAVAESNGGLVAVENGRVIAGVALPLLGLLTDKTAAEFIPQLEALYSAVAGLGCSMPWPYHNLAFASVAGELPFLKLSDRGLFDVAKRQLLPTIVE